MAEGWIKLHRQIQSCEFLWDSKDEPFDRRSAWIDLLLMANHKDARLMFNGKAITVKKGQRITSMRDLAIRWHWSRNKVKRYLDLLADEGMIVKESDNRRTLLTIVKYDFYQGERDTNEPPTEPQTSHQKATDEATDEPQKGHRRSTNKNEKNEKNEENDKNDKNEKKKEQRAPRQTYGEYSHVRLTEEEFNRLCNDYGETDTLKAIKILDEYCQESGKTYKDYNLTLRRWPISEAQKGKTTPKSAGAKDLDTLFAEWDQKYGGINNDKGNI